LIKVYPVPTFYINFISPPFYGEMKIFINAFTDQTVGVSRTRATAGTLHVAAFVRLVPIATPVALLWTVDAVHW